MNILLIQADQQRRDMLGAYGNSIVKTPALDALAHEGIVFDYAFCPSPICAPARASLITGKRPLKHGILVNSESGLAAGRDFNAKHATVAELLATRGCRSTLCGKWHVGTDLSPADCGFAGVFYEGYGYPDRHPHYRAYLKDLGVEFRLRDQVYSQWPDGSNKYVLGATQDGPVEASVPYYLASQTIEAVRQAVTDQVPFFVRCDFWGPHMPYIIPKSYADMYRPEDIPCWPNFGDDLADKPEIQQVYRRYWGIEEFGWDEWARLIAMCYAHITLMDEQVARMRAALADLGCADNTAVFYTSDHGGMTGSHGLADKGPYMYDETCRIPLVAQVPGTVGCRRSGALVYNMDLMPTILDLAGVEQPDDPDAVSLVPILQRETESIRRDDEPAYVEFHGHQAPYEQRMVRTRAARYVFNAPDTDELYDLKNDPAEMRNLVEEPSQAELLAEMRGLMRDCLVRMGDPLLAFFEGSRTTGAGTPAVKISATGRMEWS